jgi:multisubunit Na+/H+ antiporter MnhB subunit
MMGLVFDLTLCGLILGVAVAAVSGRSVFGGVVFFIVYGLLIAIAWLRLEAIDVALAEAAIGAGLTGVLLVGATARLRRMNVPEQEHGSGLARVATGAACVTITALIGYGLLSLDPTGPGLTPLVAANITQTGVGNPVTAVLLNFRAYDTLLESIVLLVALIGVWSLADDKSWGGLAGLRQYARPGGVLATFGRTLPPIGLMIGVYLVWAGSSEPGGAFQGGTVLAAVWLLIAMAGLVDAPRVTSPALRLSLVVGPALFLGIGVVGAFAGMFLGLPVAHAKSLILLIEAGLTLSIAVTLALLVVGPPQRGAA